MSDPDGMVEGHVDAVAEAPVVLRSREAGGMAGLFSRVFEQYRAQVLALSLHITGNHDDAEDAAQEAFAAIHRGLPRFRGEARISTWVYRIAVHAALRVKGRRRPTLPVDPETPDARGADAMMARVEAGQVVAALQRLPGELRVVLSLFAIEGLSHRRIADVLGVAEGTVWARLHGARKRLAAELTGPK